MADENKNSPFGEFGKMPNFDFTKLMKDFKLPGVDLATIMDREKKNIEALTEANRVAFEGWQALVHRQAEILQESIKQAVGRIGWLRAAVLGANDGISSTASLIVGVAAAAAKQNDVLIAGVAGLVAGAMSMAAGEYLSLIHISEPTRR